MKTFFIAQTRHKLYYNQPAIQVKFGIQQVCLNQPLLPIEGRASPDADRAFPDRVVFIIQDGYVPGPVTFRQISYIHSRSVDAISWEQLMALREYVRRRKAQQPAAMVALYDDAARDVGVPQQFVRLNYSPLTYQ